MAAKSFIDGCYKYVMPEEAADFWVKIGMDKDMVKGLVGTHWTSTVKTMGSESKIFYKVECEELPEANMAQIFVEGKPQDMDHPVTGKCTVSADVIEVDEYLKTFLFQITFKCLKPGQFSNITKYEKYGTVEMIDTYTAEGCHIVRFHC